MREGKVEWGEEKWSGGRKGGVGGGKVEWGEERWSGGRKGGVGGGKMEWGEERWSEGRRRGGVRVGVRNMYVRVSEVVSLLLPCVPPTDPRSYVGIMYT